MNPTVIGRAMLMLLVAGLAGLLLMPQAHAQSRPEPEHLRVVGGLAGVNQYTRHEEPFWTQQLSRLTQGQVTAEIVPFDQAGLSGPELLRAVQIGAAPFGTILLNLAADVEPEINAPDLPGLNPDFDSLRRSVQAFRPRLTQLLKQKYDIELLAVYTYPAQVIYCARPFDKLSDLAGRRIRVASGRQADFISALGGRPVQMPFSQVVSAVRAGSVDCAITGTMSGNTIGLHTVTTHIHPMAVGWGLAAFVVQSERWKRLSPTARSVLERELPVLERQIWAEAQSETEEGLACNTGVEPCKAGQKGRMTRVEEKPGDHRLRLEALHQSVLPSWLHQCGAPCRSLWPSMVVLRPDLRHP